MARATAGSMSVLVVRALVFGAMSRGIDPGTKAVCLLAGAAPT
jgi:hypothetical protein